MFKGDQKDVFWQGNGPGVILLTEIPGITPEVADFGRRIARNGFTVALPNLFGEPGRPYNNAYAMKSMTRACISKEFITFATGKSSPVTLWVQHLIKVTAEKCDGKGVGVIGMCLTGGFALSLAVNPLVKVPVMSQPSLPLPIGTKRKKDLGLSQQELAAVRERVDNDNLCVIGLRFSEDKFSPRERFQTLKETLGDGFLGVEINSSESNLHDINQSAHSVLTTDFSDSTGHPTLEAYETIIEHFKARL
ncbi:MAG: dienelactone hydrolase [Flavobacteriaceae bacterium]|nr:dienelactone hydrolase [Flavobacteriaceae bacterium]